MTIPPISPLQVADYHRDGFTVVRGVFAASETAELDVEARELLNRTDLMDPDNIRCRWQNCVKTGECRFDCFDPVIDLAPICARVARNPRLMGLVEALYGEPAHLFKDKLIFKPAGAVGYALHQDYISWPSFPRSFLTVIVAIDPSGATNGATEVFPGYHNQGCLTAEDGMYHEIPADQIDLSRGVMLTLEPGDVVAFSGLTPHRSAPNQSTQPRRLLYLSYNSNSDGGDRREAHYREFGAWLKDRYAEYGKTNTSSDDGYRRILGAWASNATIRQAVDPGVHCRGAHGGDVSRQNSGIGADHRTPPARSSSGPHHLRAA